jgi:hypothetical protein
MIEAALTIAKAKASEDENPDLPPAIADRQTDAATLRPALGTQHATALSRAMR